MIVSGGNQRRLQKSNVRPVALAIAGNTPVHSLSSQINAKRIRGLTLAGWEDVEFDFVTPKGVGAADRGKTHAKRERVFGNRLGDEHFQLICV